MPKNKKGVYIAKKGKPSGPGHEVAGLKDVKLETLESDLEIADKYVDPESDEPLQPERHPNRNLNKPDINKPRY
ncbi:MAG: hypothetical protein ACJ75J_05095 [Cytophagaceae bacterium]